MRVDVFLFTVALRFVVRGVVFRVETRPLSDVRELRFAVRMVADLRDDDDCVLVRETAVRPAVDVRVRFAFIERLADVSDPARVRVIVWRVDAVPAREPRDVTTAGPDAVMTRLVLPGLFWTTFRRPMVRRASV